MSKIINLGNLNLLGDFEITELIHKLSKIHFENLPNSFYTNAGLETVRIYYKLLLLNRNLNLIISQEENLNINGFVIWGPANVSLVKSFLKNIFKFNYAKEVNIRNLFKVEILKKIFFKLFGTSLDYKPNLNSAKIISIAVDENSQGQGIGSELINQVLIDCLRKQYGSLYAITSSYQKSAICFYKSLENFNLVFEKKISNDYAMYVFSKILK